MTTISEISSWFDTGITKGATHMFVVCDTFDYEDYPVYIYPDDNVHEKYEEYTSGKHSMQKVMEVYLLSGNKAGQLSEHRSFNFDIKKENK